MTQKNNDDPGQRSIKSPPPIDVGSTLEELVERAKCGDLEAIKILRIQAENNPLLKIHIPNVDFH